MTNKYGYFHRIIEACLIYINFMVNKTAELISKFFSSGDVFIYLCILMATEVSGHVCVCEVENVLYVGEQKKQMLCKCAAIRQREVSSLGLSD